MTPLTALYVSPDDGLGNRGLEVTCHDMSAKVSDIQRKWLFFEALLLLRTSRVCRTAASAADDRDRGSEIA